MTPLARKSKSVLKEWSKLPTQMLPNLSNPRNFKSLEKKLSSDMAQGRKLSDVERGTLRQLMLKEIVGPDAKQFRYKNIAGSLLQKEKVI